MTALLEADSVAVTFGGSFGKPLKRAVDDISLDVGGPEPKITAVVGESGSGKTTLTRLLLGFLRPTSGSVRYKGRELAAMTAEEHTAFRREVQAIFQDPFDVYNPFYKVDRVLLKPLRNFGIATSRAEAYARIEQALSTVGLRPRETLGRYPHQLSGGQRQRVMIARALLLQPKIILADEPVSMVDASLRATILESLYRLRTDLGISLIYVTHDLTTAYQISDDVVVLYGDGTGGFSAPQSVATGASPYAVLSADFNGDGKQDLATANFSGNTVSVLLGDGAGGFLAAPSPGMVTAPVSLAVGYLDGDQRLDLVVAGGSPAQVYVLLGGGDGTFTLRPLMRPAFSRLAAWRAIPRSTAT